MEIPRIRNFMQAFHALESGQVDPQQIAERGLAHALTDAARARIGRTAAQVGEDFRVYSEKVDAERTAQAEEGLLVIGLSHVVAGE